ALPGPQFDAVFSSLDSFPDGHLSPTEAPYVPTGAGGELALQSVKSTGDTIGIETTGNLPKLPLPSTGARLDVVAAGDILLHEYGFIGTLQGGDLSVSSVAGGIQAGTPPLHTVRARGIVTFYTPAGFNDREASAAGGGEISLDSFGTFDIGGGALAALSGGSI